jgi:MFS family permease
MDGWRRVHWVLFAVVAASFFLDGVLFSLVSATIFLLPDLAQNVTVIFAVNSIAFMLGAVALGRLGDVVGRRLGLIVSLVIYTVGALWFALAYCAGALDLVAAVFTTSLISFGVGGKVGPAYAALAGFAPPRRRGAALMLATNFWNIGVAVIAALSLQYAELDPDPGAAVFYTFLTAVALAALVLVARLHIPESPRWLVARGREAEAKALVEKYGVEPPPREEERKSLSGYWGRVAVFAAAFTVQLLAYYIAAYYLPYAPGFAYGAELAPLNFAVAYAGAAVGAFLLLPLIDRSRRLAFLTAFVGGLATAGALAAVHGAAAQLYLAVLFLNSVFSEWAWAAVSVLKAELFPTAVRSTAVGLVTAVGTVMAFAWLIIAAAVFTEGVFGAGPFFAQFTALWALGAAVAALWYVKGVESAGRRLEELV